jgi:4-carboxymuconolactone decarboxylase
MGWDGADRLLLQAADELHERQTLDDATWAALADRYTVPQLFDLVATVGNYHLVAMFLNATNVELDAGVPDTPMPARPPTDRA